MIYNWEFKKTGSREKISTIQKAMNVNPIIAELLINFNLDTKEKIEKYLNPKLSQLHNPFDMSDMEVAVNRVIEALREGQNIMIYGDYDVDGITSVSLLYKALFKLGGKVSFYIPNRLLDGYGLTVRSIKKVLVSNPDLIIAVDCGITAVGAVDFAKEKGIDIIICDHHETVGSLPNAFAVLNPKQETCTYPFNELAGVGVAFKLIQGLYYTLNYGIEELEQYLDLVTLGTAADIVPLIDENRVFVKYGLERINRSPRSGLFALIESSALIGKEINVSTIIYNLAPRLNAVGRMSDAKTAVHLLTCTCLHQARNLAQVLESENRVRRDVDEAAYHEALYLIEKSVDLKNDKIIILTKDDWHPGVIGIVASRLMEKYNRPTILISLKNGIGKGSARSTFNFDIYHALHSISDLLDTFGGHKYAAGFTIKEEMIEKFKNKLKDVSKKIIPEEDLIPTLEIQSEISLGQLDAKLLRWLKLFAPYGAENRRPVFVSRGLEIVGDIQMIRNNHLKLKVRQDGIDIDAIFYNFGKYQQNLNTGNQKIDSAYVIEENTWNSQTTVQMQIMDLNIV